MAGGGGGGADTIKERLSPILSKSQYVLAGYCILGTFIYPCVCVCARAHAHIPVSIYGLSPANPLM